MYNDYFDWFVGLNEGYTEVLCKRIFNKRKTSYPTNYYMCKYIETLFDNPKKMEIAYFLNNIDAVIDKFLEYGTKEEFIEINKVLDYSQKYIFLDDDKLKSTFDLLHDIIKRTNDENKIKKCEMIDAERNPSVKNLVRKIFN